MKNFILALIPLAVLLGCGGESTDSNSVTDYDLPFADADAATTADATPVDLGQTAAALTAPTRPDFGYGVNTSVAHNACSRTNTNQVCTVPLRKTWTWCIENLNQWSTPERNDVANAFEVVAGHTAATNFNSTNFAFRHNADKASGSCVADIVINRLACSGACVAAGVIDSCVCTTISEDAQLSESLPGQYFGTLSATIHLDAQDINTSFLLGSATGNAVRQHALAYAILNVVGVGGSGTDTLGNTAPLISGRAITPPTQHKLISNGELCQMQNFNPASPASFAFSGACQQD